MPDVDLAYDSCRLIAKREAKNFYYAFITLPPKKRQSIYASYAFCRLCDDASDEDLPIEEKLARLTEIRRKLSLAYKGVIDDPTDEPVFTAIADTASTFGIPEDYFLEVVAGVETDLTKHTYNSFVELTDYCYKVASVVGLCCIQIFGYSDERAKSHAIDLGVAMQLTNILRDVKEDLERGRVYIPLNEMEEFGYSIDELRDGVINEPFNNLMRFQVHRARTYFESGSKLLPYLSARERACPAVLGRLYSQILDRLEARKFDVFAGRVSLTAREKYLVTARAWVRSLLPMGSPRSESL